MKISDTSLLDDLHKTLKEHQNTTDSAINQINDKINSLALQSYCEALKECNDQNTSELGKLSTHMKEIEVNNMNIIAYTCTRTLSYSTVLLTIICFIVCSDGKSECI